MAFPFNLFRRDRKPGGAKADSASALTSRRWEPDGLFHGHGGRLDGATAGPRANVLHDASSIAIEAGLNRWRTASRARWLRLNDPTTARIVQVWATSLIGIGITMASQAPEQYRAAILAIWLDFVENCDAEGRLDLHAMLTMLVETMVVEGDAFIDLRVTEDGRLKLLALPPDLISDAYTLTELPNGGFAVNGRIYDAAGRTVAYRVLSERPAEPFLVMTLGGADIPVDRIIHVFRPLGPGQSRGLSWLLPILLALGDLGVFQDALLKQQQVAAMFAGIATDMNASASGQPFNGQQSNSLMESGLEPGTLKILPPGFDIKFATPAQAQPASAVIKNQLRSIAAAVGIPYWVLTDDLEAVNYSSMRGSLIGFRDLVASLQKQIVIGQILKPLFRRVITLAVLSGRLDLPGFDENPEPYFKATWHPPALPWVDPLKDSQATSLNLAAGLTSRRQAVAELGRDVDELDAEIAADKAREKALGLSFEPATAVTDRPTDPITDN